MQDCMPLKTRELTEEKKERETRLDKSVVWMIALPRAVIILAFLASTSCCCFFLVVSIRAEREGERERRADLKSSNQNNRIQKFVKIAD